MKSPLLLSLVAILYGCLAFSTPSRAQDSGPAAVNGTVRTGSKSPLAGASLSVLHLPTGIRKATTTNLQGHFDLNDLLAGGAYFLQFTLPGACSSRSL